MQTSASPSYIAKSCVCHRSAKPARKSFACHTCKTTVYKSFICHTSETPTPPSSLHYATHRPYRLAAAAPGNFASRPTTPVGATLARYPAGIHSKGLTRTPNHLGSTLHRIDGRESPREPAHF